MTVVSKTVTVVVDPVWLSRIRAAMGRAQPGWHKLRDEWVDQALRVLNYRFPIRNPIDSDRQYKLYNRVFRGDYAWIMAQMAKAQLKEAKKTGKDPTDCWVHVDKFLDAIGMKMRDFHKMRFWDLVEERKLTAEEKKKENKRRGGMWRLRNMGWLMMTGQVHIACRCHEFRNHRIGFSGELIDFSEALRRSWGYDMHEESKPPKDAYAVSCETCGKKDIEVFAAMFDIKDLFSSDEDQRKNPKAQFFCPDCIDAELDRRRSVIITPDLEKYLLNEMSSSGPNVWLNRYSCFMSPNPTADAEVDADPSWGSSGCTMVPPPGTKVRPVACKTLPLFEDVDLEDDDEEEED